MKKNFKKQKTSSKNASTSETPNPSMNWGFRGRCDLKLFWGLFFVFWSLRAYAQAPAQAPADQSTPQGTLVLVARATQAGDEAALQKLFHPTTPDEKRYVDAIAQQASALSKVRDATVKAFGQDVADKMGQSTIDENRIRSAKAKIDGDKASVIMEGSTDALNLVKVGGMWKVSPAQLVAGKNAQMMQQDLDMMTRLNGVLLETAKELGEGKYTTPEQLDDAIRGKRIKAMSSAGPTTAPAEGK